MTSPKTEKVIFIDRDGVINEDPIGDYVKRWADFKFISGVLNGMAKLTRLGFQIVIISNQAGVGDGVYEKSELDDITRNMLSEFNKKSIPIRAVYYCLHGKNDNCECRKPKVGLFQQAANEISFDPSKTYFIGDKATDVEAGKRFGLKTLFVLTGHGKIDQGKLGKHLRPEQTFPSFIEAVDYIESHP